MGKTVVVLFLYLMAINIAAGAIEPQVPVDHAMVVDPEPFCLRQFQVEEEWKERGMEDVNEVAFVGLIRLQKSQLLKLSLLFRPWCRI